MLGFAYMIKYKDINLLLNIMPLFYIYRIVAY